MLCIGTWQGKVPVAIKQLRDDRMDNSGGYEKAREEFLKEACIFKLVNHPNLVQVSCSKFAMDTSRDEYKNATRKYSILFQ